MCSEKSRWKIERGGGEGAKGRKGGANESSLGWHGLLYTIQLVFRFHPLSSPLA